VCFYSKSFGKKLNINIPAVKISEVILRDEETVLVNTRLIDTQPFEFQFENVQQTEQAHLFLSQYLSSKAEASSAPVFEGVLMSPRRTESFSLSNNDFDDLINAYGKKTHYNEDEIISSAGEKSGCLYQILEGQCWESTIEKGARIENVIRKLKKGDIFGEVEYILGTAPIYSVIAKSRKVEVAVFERDILNKSLVKEKPELVASFFRHLASLLNSRFEEKITASPLSNKLSAIESLKNEKPTGGSI